MTDDLVKQPRMLEVESKLHEAMADLFKAERDAARDRIEALTAQLADADAMIEAQAKDHASNNIRFAEATHRIEALTADRDKYEGAWMTAEGVLTDLQADNARLTAALEYAQGLAARYELSGTPERIALGMIGLRARAALTGKEPVAGAVLPPVDELSNIIRTVDGTHSLGAGELAERILDALTGKGPSHKGSK